MDVKFVIEGERDYSWDDMLFEFTTETTHGEISDEEIAKMDDKTWIETIEKYTGYKAVENI